MMIERLLIRHNALWLVGAIVAALLAGLYITSGDQSEAERQAEQYCEMVDAWHDTGGQTGWPPYDGECDDE